MFTYKSTVFFKLHLTPTQNYTNHSPLHLRGFHPYDLLILQGISYLPTYLRVVSSGLPLDDTSGGITKGKWV